MPVLSLWIMFVRMMFFSKQKFLILLMMYGSGRG